MSLAKDTAPQQQGQQPATPQQTAGQAPKPIFRDWAAL